jgi:hypothetical protein
MKHQRISIRRPFILLMTGVIETRGYKKCIFSHVDSICMWWQYATTHNSIPQNSG